MVIVGVWSVCQGNVDMQADNPAPMKFFMFLQLGIDVLADDWLCASNKVVACCLNIFCARVGNRYAGRAVDLRVFDCKI